MAVDNITTVGLNDNSGVCGIAMVPLNSSSAELSSEKIREARR